MWPLVWPLCHYHITSHGSRTRDPSARYLDRIQTTGRRKQGEMCSRHECAGRLQPIADLKAGVHAPTCEQSMVSISLSRVCDGSVIYLCMCCIPSCTLVCVLYHNLPHVRMPAQVSSLQHERPGASPLHPHPKAENGSSQLCACLLFMLVILQYCRAF